VLSIARNEPIHYLLTDGLASSRLSNTRLLRWRLGSGRLQRGRSQRLLLGALLARGWRVGLPPNLALDGINHVKHILLATGTSIFKHRPDHNIVQKNPGVKDEVRLAPRLQAQ